MRQSLRPASAQIGGGGFYCAVETEVGLLPVERRRYDRFPSFIVWHTNLRVGAVRKDIKNCFILREGKM